MAPQQLEHLATRHAVFFSAVLTLPHSQDGYERWRAQWRNVTELVDKIGRRVRTAS